MGFLTSMDISASALTAQRMRMDIVAENIANAQTTRTADGTPYRRRFAIFQERTENRSFASYMQTAQNNAETTGAQVMGNGVRVSGIGEDQSPFLLDYNPSHPDADEAGYVRMPNVETAREMVDMMSATRSYQANITALNAFKDMSLKALEIGR